MKGWCAAIVLLALAAGCSDAQKPAGERVEDYAGELGTDAATSREPKGGGAKAVAEANDVWDFKYAYPAQAGRIPSLRAMLDARQAQALAELKDQAIEGRAFADEQGFPFNPYALDVTWETVADLPDWLSLSSQIYSFTGGAHGNTGFDALLWDKRANKPLEPASLFASPEALQAAVSSAFCTALNKQREERRGEPVDPNADDWMNACPKVADTTLILGSSNSRTFDRIGFLIDPYTAGPYAEGTYEVTLPVTAAVRAAVKPQHAPSFTVTR